MKMKMKMKSEIKAKQSFILYSTYSIPHRQAKPFMVFNTADEALEFWEHDGCSPWAETDSITPPTTYNSVEELSGNGSFDNALEMLVAAQNTDEQRDALNAFEQTALQIVEAIRGGKSVTAWSDWSALHWGLDRDAVLRHFVTTVPTGDDAVCTYDEGDDISHLVDFLVTKGREDLIDEN